MSKNYQSNTLEKVHLVGILFPILIVYVECKCKN